MTQERAIDLLLTPAGICSLVILALIIAGVAMSLRELLFHKKNQETDWQRLQRETGGTGFYVYNKRKKIIGFTKAQPTVQQLQGVSASGAIKAKNFKDARWKLENTKVPMKVLK